MYLKKSENIGKIAYINEHFQNLIKILLNLKKFFTIIKNK